MKKIFRIIQEKFKDWWFIKVKLTIAEFIHARTSTCWAELVSWSSGHTPLKEVLKNGVVSCVMEASNTHGIGCCYCGRYINSKHGYDPNEAPSECVDVNPDKNYKVDIPF